MTLRLEKIDTKEDVNPEDLEKLIKRHRKARYYVDVKPKVFVGSFGIEFVNYDVDIYKVVVGEEGASND